MTAFLRAVKFIFNFCFYKVFRGVFSDFPPSLQESNAGSREAVITVALGGAPATPSAIDSRGWHSLPGPQRWPELAGTCHTSGGSSS